MPHKDRTARLEYLRRWKAAHRPHPEPDPQSDPALPPRGLMRHSADGELVQCHACGAWLGSLNTHLRAHGLDAASYKALYDLPRTASLLPPVTQQRYRDAALARDQGTIGREHIPPAHGRPKGNRTRSRADA